MTANQFNLNFMFMSKVTSYLLINLSSNYHKYIKYKMHCMIDTADTDTHEILDDVNIDNIDLMNYEDHVRINRFIFQLYQEN